MLLKDNTVVFEASDFLTIALLVALEALLSADNAMVLAVLVLGLPKPEQKKALRYGIIGAFAFRTLATLAAAYLIRLGWVKLVGAGYLLYLAVNHFYHSDAESRRTPPRAKPWLGLSAFWATVVKVELTDIVFAIDSILVAVAMSPKIWVILTGGLLGIVAMRVVIGRLLSLIERYPPLVDGAFVIIAWVGVKLLIEYLHKAGYIHLEVPNFDLAGHHRGDFRGLVSLCTTASARGGPLRQRRRCEAAVRRNGRRRLVASLETPDRPTLAFVRRSRRRHLRAVDSFKPAHLDLFRRRRGREIFIQLPGLDLRDMAIGQPSDDDALLAAERPADQQFVAGAQQAIWFRRLTVDVDLAALAGVLRFRTRPE